MVLIVRGLINATHRRLCGVNDTASQGREVCVLLGARIRFLRKQRGLSQEDLAGLAGMDRTYMGGIERGERNPSLKNLLRIALALGVTLPTLFSDWVSDDATV